MLKYLVIPALALMLTALPLSARADDPAVIGTILAVEGKATLTLSGSKDETAAAANTHIHMGDIIRSGAKSRVFVQFIDDTQITLSENSKLTVDEYVFNPENKADDKARYNVLGGAFSYLSGLVAKKKDPDVKIKTAYGSIGIRGTKLWGGNVGGGYGIHVQEGLINVSNAGGNVNVPAGEGTIIPGPDQPPGPPGPWPPGQLDGLLGGVGLKHHNVHDLVGGHKGENGKLLKAYLDWLHKHGKGKEGDNGDDPDTRMKDLPMDETGAPEVAPYTPDPGGRLDGGGN